MNFLYIAPLPPPINGHSVAAKVLYDQLKVDHTVSEIDLSLSSTSDGTITFRRFIEVFKVLLRVWIKNRHADAIYLTISESVAGNIKDLAIYSICFWRLKRLFIHLHGGSIKKLLFDRYPVLRWLNTIAIRRMAGVIISGRSHADIFASMIDPHRIHVIPNFAQGGLFIDEHKIAGKFSRLNTLRLLYISGMTPGKGYLQLLEAYQFLDDSIKQSVHIDFAGRFDSESERDDFTRRIIGIPGITYHGVVDNATKESLFANAHIFCLPTSFLEGQPISILEAYASGCVVLTTGQPGILDVFLDGVNGYLIQPNHPESIRSIITKIHSSFDGLLTIAIHNRRTAADQYRTDVFAQRVTQAMLSGSISSFAIKDCNNAPN
ncbi:MAG: glycosyltransferase family 4 protein [Betaproteobacteria bacterium]|nr:glycosyltransferase family 4 protein [Betaproteobacteria bacterium]